MFGVTVSGSSVSPVPTVEIPPSSDMFGTFDQLAQAFPEVDSFVFLFFPVIQGGNSHTDLCIHTHTHFAREIGFTHTLRLLALFFSQWQ